MQPYADRRRLFPHKRHWLLLICILHLKVYTCRIPHHVLIKPIVIQLIDIHQRIPLKLIEVTAIFSEILCIHE